MSDDNELIEKLRGTYRIPITDGLGPAGGDEPNNADFFVRSFPTSPLALEAADAIERLTRERDEARQQIAAREVRSPPMTNPDPLEKAAKAMLESDRLEGFKVETLNDYCTAARAAIRAYLSDEGWVEKLATAEIMETARRNCDIAGVPFDPDRYDEFDVMVAYSNARAVLARLMEGLND